MIDVELGGMIVARHPGVTVGRPQCPFLIDLSGGGTGHCTVPIGNAALPVEVDMAAFPDNIQSADTVFVRADAERFVAAHLPTTEHHESPNCGGASVRIVPIGTSIPCEIAPAPNLRFLHVTIVNGYGDLIMNGTDWLDGPRSPGRLLGRDVAARTAVGVVIGGARMEEYLRATVGGEKHDELARRKLIFAARCPPRLALKPGAHATCTVRVGTRLLTYDLRFDEGRGLVVDTDQVIEIVPDVRALAERFFAHALPVIRPALPAGSRVRIDCGSTDVALLVPGETLACTAYAGHDTIAFAARLLDQDGNVVLVRRYGR